MTTEDFPIGEQVSTVGASKTKIDKIMVDLEKPIPQFPKIYYIKIPCKYCSEIVERESDKGDFVCFQCKTQRIRARNLKFSKPLS